MFVNRSNQFGVWGGYVIFNGNAVGLVEEACRCGVRIFQYRDKSSTRKRIVETAIKLSEISNRYKSLFIINDFIDVAFISGADGVHLGQDDIPIDKARKIVPDGFIIGISTHSVEQAKKAEAKGADYISIGPVFDTPIKPDYETTGIDTVRTVIESISIPVVAIGGINLENIGSLKELGVTNVAMIRGFAVNTQKSLIQVNKILLGENWKNMK